MRLDLSALPSDTVFSPELSRVLLNVVILAAESLPRGGTLALSGTSQARVLATIRGQRAAWPDTLAASLASEAVAWAGLDNPRNLLAPLVALIAHRLGIPLALLRPARASPAAADRCPC
jgi:histidine phosphotransferase ChpT